MKNSERKEKKKKGKFPAENAEKTIDVNCLLLLLSAGYRAGLQLLF